MLKLTYHLMELPMEFAFTISRNTKTVAKTVRVELAYDHDGASYSGLGEAVPCAFYGEDEQTVMNFYQQLVQDRVLEDLDPTTIEDVEARLRQHPGHMAAKAGIEIACHDLWGKIRQQPVYDIWGLDPTRLPKTSYTIGMDAMDTVRKKMETALQRGFDVIKVKLGGPDDLEMIRLIRAMAPSATVRVDANAGWTLKEALTLSETLHELNIEFIEAPLKLECHDAEFLELKTNGAVPIMADENCHTLDDIPRCAELFHSVNLKPTKTGGLAEARRMIQAAHTHDLKVMLGGFAETSISVTAFAHLAPLVEYADLDACLLIADDPYEGIQFNGSVFELPTRPGIGVIPRASCPDTHSTM